MGNKELPESGISVPPPAASPSGRPAPNPEQIARVYERELDEMPQGHTDAQTGAALGVGGQTVSDRISNVKKTVTARWEAYGNLWSALALLVLIVGVALWKKHEDASRVSGHSPDVSPTEVRKSIADLRRQAREACDRGDFETCGKRLDDAAEIDPAGEKEPAVLELRHRSEANRAR
jgi:hypothetical protein